jgi:hypothetical protein
MCRTTRQKGHQVNLNEYHARRELPKLGVSSKAVRPRRRYAPCAPSPRCVTVALTSLLSVALLALTAAPAFAHEAHVRKSSFGSLGSGSGQLSLKAASTVPGSGLAVNQKTGAIYVADTGNHRVDVFDKEGTFLRAWGFGVADGTTNALQSCTVGCHAGIAGSAPGQLSKPTIVAVDNSAGGEGDVYVIDNADELVTKYDAEGHLISSWGNNGPGETPNGQLSGFSGFTGSPVSPLTGLVVDSAGHLWVYADDSLKGERGGRAQMYEFSAAGTLITEWATNELGYSVAPIAITPEDDFFLDGALYVAKFDSSGTLIGHVRLRGNGTVTGLAADPSTGELYEGFEPNSGLGGPEIFRYPASCEPAVAECTATEQFGAGQLSAPQGVTVGPGHAVYVAEAGASRISVYQQVRVPDVITGPASNLAQTTATVEGEVNPDGLEVTECVFEYGPTAAYGETAPCATENAEPIGSGSAAVKVHADLSSLAASPYHYRLIAGNVNATERGDDRIFGASIDEEIVKGAGAAEATLAAKINPNGADTTCQLQYVSEAAFNTFQFAGATTVVCEPPDLGSAVTDIETSVSLSGLSPATNYRFRFLATNGGHVTDGPDHAFFTPADVTLGGCPNESLRAENGSLALPDCRGYEQVSPNDNAEVFVPSSGLQQGESSVSGYAQTETPMQASADGSSVAYVGEPPPQGSSEGTGNAGPGEGDQFLASRSSSGWSSTDVQPLGRGPGTAYQAFSTDLGLAVLTTGKGEVLAGGVETECPLLYSRDSAGASFAPLFTSEGNSCAQPAYVGASGDGGHLLFESAAAKSEALPAGAARPAAGKGHENIYDSAAGRLYLVNVLPGPAHKSVPDATIGSLANEPQLLTSGGGAEPIPPVNASNVVSDDGSRIFWTDLKTGVVYVRENDTAEPSAESAGACTEPEKACTVPLSAGPATYETATPDGRFGYYIEAGQLWRYDVETGTRMAVTGPAAEVYGVIGINHDGEDGAYLYFVAGGILAGNTVDNGNGPEQAQSGQPNLYLARGNDVTFVATLSPKDDEFSGNPRGLNHPEKGDWRPVLGYRSSELSSDGVSLIFMSNRRLTAYRNVDAGGETVTEIYLYDAASGQVSCASCAPTGAAPPHEGDKATDNRGRDTYLPGFYSSATHQGRWISADGSRVVFSTNRPLSSTDTNAALDVYEWERDGSGSCVSGSTLNGGGCLYLLSDGTGSGGSLLLDSDEAGNNVFFISRARPATVTGSGKANLFDARVDGGFPVAKPVPACAGREACGTSSQSVPAIQTPGTAGFQASESPTKCRRGYVPRHGVCRHKPHHKHKHAHKRSGRNHRHAHRRADGNHGGQK